MKFKRILVAVSHSPLESIVVERTLYLAQQTQAQLMILHCLVDVPGFVPAIELGGVFSIASTGAGYSQEQAQVWLQEIYQRATTLNIPTEYESHFGEAGSMICMVAQRWCADLIILGRHDDSAIVEFFTGSVSNHVVHHAHCSVLVVKDDTNKLAVNTQLELEEPQIQAQTLGMAGMSAFT